MHRLNFFPIFVKKSYLFIARKYFSLPNIFLATARDLTAPLSITSIFINQELRPPNTSIYSLCSTYIVIHN